MSERERDNTRDRAELIIIKIDEAKGVVRGAREIDKNSRSEAIVGLIDYIINNWGGLEV